MASKSGGKRPKFLGLALVSGPGRYTEPASLAFDRNLKSERADFVPVTDAELLSLIHEASAYLEGVEALAGAVERFLDTQDRSLPLEVGDAMEANAQRDLRRAFQAFKQQPREKGRDDG